LPFFDTHAHLDNQQLSNDALAVVQRAKEAGVESMTAIGTDLTTSQKCVSLAIEFDGVYAAVGVHPTTCHKDEVADCWDEVVSLAKQQAVVAIGETGLDLHWDKTTLDIQRTWFQQHIDLSFETGKPLVIHMRDCEQEIVSMLESSCLKLGMYISFAGMVTFKKSDELRAVAAEIPADRILIETDAPYLSPHPLRSKRPNEPAYIVHTAACLADVRDISPEQLGRITTENAKRVFRIE